MKKATVSQGIIPPPVIKMSKRVICSLAAGLLLFSCSNDEFIADVVVDDKDDSASEAVIVVDEQRELPPADSIIPFNYDDFPEPFVPPMTRATPNDELGIEGIVGMPVNIIVKENASSRRYVTDVGLNKAIRLEVARNNNNQKFYLQKMPAGSAEPGDYYLTAYARPQYKLRINSDGGTPLGNSLYIVNNTNVAGCGLFFVKGTLDDTSIVIFSPYSWYRAYYDRWGHSIPNGVRVHTPFKGDSSSGRLYFPTVSKVLSLPPSPDGTQQFEIRPADEFEVVEMTQDLSGITYITDEPDFIIKTSYRNGSNVQQTITTSDSQRAQVTSTINRKTSLTTQVSAETRVGIEWLFGGKFSMSVGYNEEWSWGKQESHDHNREYSFPLVIPPYTRADVSIIVTRKKASIDYKARLRGKTTGRYIWEYGTWENVDCTDIVVDVNTYDIASGQKIRSKTFNDIPTTPVRMD